MDDILSQIIAYAPDKIDTELKAAALVQGSRNMDQEPRIPFGDGLSVDPERDSFKKISNVLGAYRRYRRGEKNPALNFNQFFELFSTENFASGGSAGQLVQPNADGSRPGYAGDETFLVKVGDPKKLKNVIEQEFIEVTGSKNRPETYKKTGVKKTLYKPQIVVGNKTVLTTDFGSKDDATAAVEKYRKTTPIKNAPPDLNTLDEKKKKKYLDKRKRSAKIIAGGGVENFATGDNVIHKGHAQNINNPDVPIKPSNIIYTPEKINRSMAGQGSKISPTDLDYKIDEAENKIRDIKKSNMSGAKKKVELEKLDTKLMKYVADSNGYKTVTLSGGNTYGQTFQKNKSMDMFDEFPDMTEKETKKFVNQYFNDEGKLKDKWTKGNVSSVDKANIQKSYVFLENIENAKANAKQTASLLEKLGCGKSAGGRIKFNKGTTCAIKGREILEKGLKNGFKGNDVGLAKKILGSGKFLKEAVSLRGLFGPAALAFTALTEAGFVSYDMLSTGKSFKEAIGSSLFNYMLGDKTKIDSEEEFIKRLQNIKTGPSGLRDFSDEEIGKMQYFKENLKDMGTGFDLNNKLYAIGENRKQIGSNPEDVFNEGAFQLDLDKQENAVRADIQDFNRTNTPNKVTDYLLSDKAKEGANALEKAGLLVEQDQLQDAGTGKFYQSPRGDKKRLDRSNELKYDIEKMYNPTKINEFGQMFMDATPGEQSYFMGRTDFMEGGIASLNVNKK